jgi:hypothetical protein
VHEGPRRGRLQAISRRLECVTVEGMARLRRVGGTEEIRLPARGIVGRSKASNVVLSGRWLSSEHASIAWMGEHWVLRDLSSKNGTYVDGAIAEPGKSVWLRSGTRIAFGDPEESWELTDASAPGIAAIELRTGAVIEGSEELLALPSDDRPELSVHLDRVGWVVEDALGNVRPLADQEVLKVGASSFRLELPVISEATPLVQRRMSKDEVEIRFAVSANEETVAITLASKHGAEKQLPPREHGYLLLTLARARAEDSELPAAERGWRTLDELSRMLRAEINSINVSIHRARQQLAAAGLEGAAAIVETRQGMRRFGTDRFKIVPL